MKDMGVVDVTLGIKISRTPQGLVLSQSHYVDKMLKKYKKQDIVIAKISIGASLHLGKNNGDRILQLEYSRMSCIRLNIAYDVSKLSSYTSNPS